MDLGRSRSNSKIAWEKIMNKNRIPTIRFKSFFNHWSNTGLKAVKDVRDGTHSSPKYIENGYPLVTSKNLTDSGLNLNDVSLISESDYIEINKRSKVEAGDILLGLIGTIGKPVLVEIDGFAIKNVGLIKNGGQIQNQFLLQYLKTNIFNKYIQIEMAGNTQKFLGLETLRNTKVPIPSPEEQSAIGSLFRTLDDLLSSYKDNLANYQSLKTTMLSKMFPKAGQTVPEIRLDGFEGEWKFIRLGKVLLEAYQGINTTSDKVEYSVSGIPILQAKHITNGQINYKDTRYLDMDIYEHYISKYMPKKGEILFANIGTIGPSVLVDTDELFLIAWNILKMSIKDNYSPVFIKLTLSLLDSKHIFERITTGNATKFINKDEIMDIRISVPSLPEQQAIGAYFSNLDNLINSHQEKISQLETLKKKLLQDMFI